MIKVKEKKNFAEGPIFGRILLFVIPLILTGLLQVAYNMADNIVVGQFSGDPNALGAVGQAASYYNFVMNFCIGISTGAGVVVAQLFGAGEREKLSRAVHTSMTLSAVVGGILLAVGLICVRPVLSIIVKDTLLEKSILYMTIICLGLPASAVYNFGASILRSIGDSRRPLIILSLSGILNVALNLVFVIGFNMSVAGVALATIASQYASAMAVVVILIRETDEGIKLKVHELRIEKVHLLRILYLGIPAAIQSAVFSISNMFMTKAISTFPESTINANTIAGNIDGITFVCMNAFTASVMTFAGQNYGAKKRDRLRKVFIYSVLQVTVVGILIALVELLLADPLINLYIGADAVDHDAVAVAAKDIMLSVLPLYFLCGIMNVIVGYLRGVGMSTGPMIASLIGSVGLRVLWIFAFFPMYPESVRWLYVCFPLTWVFTILVTAFMYIYKQIKIKNEFAACISDVKNEPMSDPV